VLEIADLMEALGLKRNAVYNRLEIIGPLLEEIGHLKRGANNRVLVTGEGLNLMRVLEDKHAAGVTLQAAVSDIRREMGRGPDRPPEVEDRLLRRVNALELDVATLRSSQRSIEDRVDKIELRLAPEERMLPRLIHRLFPRREPEGGRGTDQNGGEPA